MAKKFSMFPLWLFFIISIALPDYVMPPFPVVVKEATIVDATIVEHLGNGKVRLQVHEVLIGQDPPEEIQGVWTSCYGLDLTTRLKLGKRYIIFLHGTQLYEENTFYEVTLTDGKAQCKCWDGNEKRLMTVKEFKKLINAASTRQSME